MKIKAVCTDVDGVLTDGRINISSHGELFKSFNVKDGSAIKSLLESNIPVFFITGRKSDIVEKRAQELGVTEVYQHVSDKMEVFQQIKKKLFSSLHISLSDKAIVYVGDDIADNEVLAVTTSFCPADATEETKKAAQHMLKSNGGTGCFREVVTFLKDNNMI